MRCGLTLALALALEGAPVTAQSMPQPAASKPATAATKTANAAVSKALPFGDKSDFEDVQRGFIGKPDTLIIKDAKGNVIWDSFEWENALCSDP